MDEITKEETVVSEADTDINTDTQAQITENEDVEEKPEADDSAVEAKGEDVSVDYDALIAEDIATLKSAFPELSALDSITELDNPIRYAALRDLGLSAEEAYLATTKRAKRDNRAHLTTAYGKNATPPASTMSQRELSEARELFGNLSDLEIQRLYKRVKERS